MIIQRDAQSTLLKFASQYPAVAILGPRQSGKTTLAKLSFPNHRYISFEDIDMRSFVSNDPRKFLNDYKNDYGLILDEIQHIPDLLSYIQTYIDSHDLYGYFIITGSQNLLVNQAVSQTLAGRMAMLTLLPLSVDELKKNSLLESLDLTICKGGYPRIYAKDTDYLSWYPFYIRQYIERDVRQITMVQDLDSFERFLKLCSGRIGQILNVSSLAADCGISTFTARSWLSILQATYIIFLVHPYYKNFSKRLIKSPKLYFYDTGIACALLGIKTEEQLFTHYLYGGLFESFAISQLAKEYNNKGEIQSIYFWRDSFGNEVDSIIENGTKIIPIEFKAGQTINNDFFKGLSYWYELTNSNPEDGYLVYGGNQNQNRSKGHVLSWDSISNILKNK